MIPNTVHFVFGLRAQDEPMHFLHYVAVESARRVLEPDTIYFHYHHEPWGPWWDRIAPHVTPMQVGLVAAVDSADYSSGVVPERYLYAHHADFVRLDALLAHGGIYADIDTIFLRRPPPDLYEKPFVIGEEPPVTNPLTGETGPSLCNALMMSEPGSRFARGWRHKMASALDGTWSSHSGALAHRLGVEMPGDVHVEAEATFYPFRTDPASLYGLLLADRPVPDGTVSVHLWAHLWWDRRRRDFTPVHAGWCTPSALRRASTTLARFTRPYLPAPVIGWSVAGEPGHRRQPGTSRETSGRPWLYLSPDEDSGYGTAARRALHALKATGVEVDWTPMIPSPRWGLGYAVPLGYDPFDTHPRPDDVVIAHHVPEYYPRLRASCREAFLVGHTAWETDKPPSHWRECLDAANLLVVPSNFSAQALAASGTTTPIEVVPHAISNCEPAPLDPLWGVEDDRFVFYTIADWTHRKGVDATIEAYLRAFRHSDPVLLVVKTSRADRYFHRVSRSGALAPGSTALALARIVGRHSSAAEIRLVTAGVSDRQIAALHRRGDCYVSLCRGEGWGVGAFDAAAAGNPVVTTGWGGHLDYLEGSPHLVRFELVPAEDPSATQGVTPDQRWAAPDVDHAASLLRDVFRFRREGFDDVRARAASIRAAYSPQAVGAAFRDAVGLHMGRREAEPRGPATAYDGAVRRARPDAGVE